MTVSWTPPTDIGDSAVTSYNVVVERRGLDGWDQDIVKRCVSDIFLPTTGLTVGTRYRFIVSAQNRFGEGPESEPSEVQKTETIGMIFHQNITFYKYFM